MTLSILATAILALLAMAPGWVLMRGRVNHPGQISAAMAVSLTLTMLGTALIGVALEVLMGWQIPAWSLGAVALIAIVFAARVSKESAGPSEAEEAPGFLIGLVFAAFGLFSLLIATGETAEGGLLVHSWYNADWFKHLGHVHALANEGVPARDIFGGGAPLYYYWLVYILPGAGTAIGGDAWAALSTANAIITVLFTATLYGLVRCVAPLRIACLVTFLALFITAPVDYFLLMVSGDGLQSFLETSDGPRGPALLSISQFIPQHALATTVFMAWAGLAAHERTDPRSAVYLLSIGAMASLLTISVLLGAMLLTTYGFVELYRRGPKAVPELALTAIASLAFAAAIGVVQLSNPDSALESPLLTNAITQSPWYLRAIEGLKAWTAYCGPAFLFVVFLIYRWRSPEGLHKFIKTIAVSLILSAFIILIATQIFAPPRIANEALIRAVIPAGLCVALVGGWAVTAGWAMKGRGRMITAAMVLVFTVIAVPCAYVRTVWMTDFTDEHTTLVPPDDRRVLTVLRERSEPTDQVWQHPEPPLFSRERGGDNWSVILAGRTVPNSERATDFSRAAVAIEETRRFFSGEDVEIPVQIDWVYVSRALEPGGYEVTVARLKTDAEWDETVCYPDACLFERASESAK
ncbi:MAG: hypothetical protein AAF553_04635 [Pseudomonadota bacterium]